MGGETPSCLNQSPTVPAAMPMPNGCMKRRYQSARSSPKIAASLPHHSTWNFVKKYSDTLYLYDSYTEVDWSINVSDLCSKSHCLKSQSSHILLYRHVTSHVNLTIKFQVYVNFWPTSIETISQLFYWIFQIILLCLWVNISDSYLGFKYVVTGFMKLSLTWRN